MPRHSQLRAETFRALRVPGGGRTWMPGRPNLVSWRWTTRPSTYRSGGGRQDCLSAKRLKANDAVPEPGDLSP